jgi:hypothetical protein
MKLIQIRDRFDAIAVENAFKETVMKNNSIKINLNPESKYLTGSITV